MAHFSSQYNLEERTARLGEKVIRFCKKIRQDTITRPLIGQVIRSATSIGANYCEANNASSKKDFKNKIFLCKKESQETKHWLRMLAQGLTENERKEARELWVEAQELTMIFQKIINSLK